MKKKFCFCISFVAVLFLLTSCTALSGLMGGPHMHTYSQAWTSDDVNHWHVANCGHPELKSAFSAHIDGNEDGTCDVCEKEYYDPDEFHTHTFRAKWSYDSENHWHESICGHSEEKSDFGAHSDTGNDGICDVCKKEYYTPIPPHYHTFSDEWSSDAESHWHAASCEHVEEKSDTASHIDSQNDGVCDVCEYGKITERKIGRLFTNGDVNKHTIAPFEYLVSEIYIKGTYKLDWTGDIIIKINDSEIANGSKIYSETSEKATKVYIYPQNNPETTSFTLVFSHQFLNDFATVTPDSGIKNTIYRGDSELFIDRTYTWGSSTPEYLKGLPCIKGMCSTGPSVTVNKAGWIYVLTPSSGTASQVSTLEALGFETVSTIDEGEISKNISGKISFMGRMFDVGETLSYTGGWIIIISDIDESYVDTDPRDWSLLAPDIIISPEEKLDEHPEYKDYLDGVRLWQGMASIAKDNESGKLFATWYSGGDGEGNDNFALLYTSDDDGRTWTGPVVVVDPSKKFVRAFDPNLWTDPDGRVWFIWTQSFDHTDGRFGVWAMYTENPEADIPVWSEPKRLCNGVGICDPIVLENAVGDLPSGTWLLPAAIWDRDIVPDSLQSENHPNCYVSFDKGATWTLYGSVPSTEANRTYDENMIVENSDGTLTMYIRTEAGIEKSTSADGKTWTPSVYAGITQTSARFWIGRLDKSTLLAVYNAEGRSKMTAALSYDDGATWGHKIQIYSPYSIYPDVHIDNNGKIYIITCENPFTNMKINMAKLTKEDIAAGRIVASGSYLRIVINDNTKQEEE